MDKNTKERLHVKLLSDISAEIPENGQEHESLKTIMKCYVPVGLLEGKTVLQLFEELTRKRYLKAGQYDTLETICNDSGNENLVDLIHETQKKMNVVQTEESNTGASTSNQTRANQDNVVSEPKCLKTDDVMKFYPTTKQKGIMLILNYKEHRKGADKDVENMKEFFEKQLHYHVFDPRSDEENDFTTEQLDSKLREIRRWLNGSFAKVYHCFICVILSHGNEEGIKTKDGIKKVEDIRQEFNNHNVPGFVGRPKVFLIQACRIYGIQGNVPTELRVNEPATKEVVVNESVVIVRVPDDADTLLAFSTTPGYRSFLRLGTGSWFITECVRVFTESYKQEHLEEMLITVRNNVAHSEEWQTADGRKQMPCIWSTLTRRLML